MLTNFIIPVGLRRNYKQEKCIANNLISKNREAINARIDKVKVAAVNRKWGRKEKGLSRTEGNL